MRHATAGILAGLCVSVCFAQDDAVVITATRFQDSKRDLPVGVTVISAPVAPWRGGMLPMSRTKLAWLSRVDRTRASDPVWGLRSTWNRPERGG